jgi:hypothetical protein
MKRRKKFERLVAVFAHRGVFGQRRMRGQIAFHLGARVTRGKDREAGNQRARLAARRVESLRRAMQPRQRLARGARVRRGRNGVQESASR